MKKKDLIFMPERQSWWLYLLRESVQMSWFQTKPLLLKANPSPSWKAPEVAVAEKSVAPVAKQLCSTSKCDWTVCGTCEQGSGFRKWNPICRESYRSIDDWERRNPLPSNTGSTTFFNTGAHAPAGRSTDVAVQPKSFVDVSSHNGDISIETTVP